MVFSIQLTKVLNEDIIFEIPDNLINIEANLADQNFTVVTKLQIITKILNSIWQEPNEQVPFLCLLTIRKLISQN